MHSRAKQVSALFLPALLFGMLLLGACENDLSKIKAISAKVANLPIDTTRGVEIIYSDSAKVKGKMIAPLLIHYSLDKDKSYYTMPKGVKMIFYEDMKETGNIVSDSAVRHDKDESTEFYRNVVITNSKGETYKSEEFIYDKARKIFYSNKPVVITTATGDVMNGINFKSDDKFNHEVLGQSTGVFNVSETPLK